MDGATANAGRKWHDQSVHFWSESTRELVVVSPLQPGHPLPDLARGTGGPVTLAEQVGPTGHVVATDLARQMIAIAQDNATRAGLRNLSFEVLDAP